MNDWTPEAIKDYRLSNKITRRLLASLLGVSFMSIYHYETGVRTPDNPTKILLTQIRSKIGKKMKGGKKVMDKTIVLDYDKNFQVRVMNPLDYEELPENTRPDIITVWEAHDLGHGEVSGEKTLTDNSYFGLYLVLEVMPRN